MTKRHTGSAVAIAAFLVLGGAFSAPRVDAADTTTAAEIADRCSSLSTST
jgi:hypothetical protein